MLTDHYATCASWQTGWSADCSCRPMWRIRRAAGPFKWHILRWTGLGYLRIMEASTFDRAVALVDEFFVQELSAVRSDVV